MFYSCKSQFREKNPILPFNKFLFLVLVRNTIMLPHLIIHSSLHYLSTGRLREVKNKGKFQTFSYKSGRGRLREVVAYKRFQIFIYSDLSCKLLVFCKNGRWGEVVANGGSTVLMSLFDKVSENIHLNKWAWLKGGDERRNRNSYRGNSVFALKGYQKRIQFCPLKGSSSIANEHQSRPQDNKAWKIQTMKKCAYV